MANHDGMLRNLGIRTSAVGLFALALGAVGFSAAPASARNDFQNGFEDQMGRILAFEAFHVGQVILSGGAPYAYHGDGPVYEERVYYPAPPPVYYRPYYARPRSYHKHRDCDRVESHRDGRRGGDDRYDRSGYWRDRRNGWRY